MNSKYKILSLDGGGSWAILQVLALQDIFSKKYPDKEIRGHEVLRHFDLVFANSGGSMVLAALACNWTFEEILHFFDDPETRNSIFRKLRFRERYFPTNFMRLFGIKSIGTRYSTTDKGHALRKILKIHKGPKLCSVDLKDLPQLIGKDSLEIVVTTFDIINRRAKLFRSNPNSRARAEVVAGDDHFDLVNLVEAIHGSSNAPVNYFDFPALFGPSGENSHKRFYLWDGALGGFNNPVMAAVTEAFANGVKREDIHVLSMGTGGKLVSDEEKRSFYDQYYSTLRGKRVRRIKGVGNSKIKLTGGRFFRLFRGAGFYVSTISHLSQSILFEPQTWANYSAYTSLFQGDLEEASNNHRFVRLSPQISIDEHADEVLHRLYQMDMDVTEQEEVDLLKLCFERWKNGEINNEPVQWVKTINGKYIFAKGHPRYTEGVKSLSWL
jgi:patatin-like phospholipase/acyl hydrolase